MAFDKDRPPNLRILECDQFNPNISKRILPKDHPHGCKDCKFATNYSYSYCHINCICIKYNWDIGVDFGYISSGIPICDGWSNPTFFYGY